MNEIKILIRNDYDGGFTIKQLSEKYKIKEGTIKSWASRENWKKKEKVATNNATNNKKMQPKKKKVASIGCEKKIEVQKEIILNGNKKSDKQIMEELGVSNGAYYTYKKQIRQSLNERSQKILQEALEYAYPDELEILKRVKGKKRNILISSIKLIEDYSMSKDAQTALNKALANIKIIEKEIMEDIQVIGIDKQAEYEKELVREELDRDKYKLEEQKNVNGSNEETGELINFIEDLDYEHKTK